MIEFAYPWLFLLLPLPLLVYSFGPEYKEPTDSLRVPFFARLVSLTGQTPADGVTVEQRMWFQKIWLAVAWVLLIVAMAKPELVGEPQTQNKSARDLMVAVDLSGSMEVQDFSAEIGENVDRLTAVKSVLSEFVSQREYDRLGLIVFGDAAFLQAPFTQDHSAWLELLGETEIGMAGNSTMFGDAIGLAISLFEKSDSDNKILIVLTDGNDTGSKVPPIDAAKVAQTKGITIYTIAIGDPETTGEEALDIAVLKSVASLTAGEYYYAGDRDELAAIYQRINELEPELYETLSYRPRLSMHHVPIAIVVVGYAVFFPLMGLLMYLRNRQVAHD
jgi:Ca-activated chloride channel family protein